MLVRFQMYNWFILKDYEACSVRGQGGRRIEDADETRLWDLDSEEQSEMGAQGVMMLMVKGGESVGCCS